LALLAL